MVMGRGRGRAGLGWVGFIAVRFVLWEGVMSC